MSKSSFTGVDPYSRMYDEPWPNQQPRAERSKSPLSVQHVVAPTPQRVAELFSAQLVPARACSEPVRATTPCVRPAELPSRAPQYNNIAKTIMARHMDKSVSPSIQRSSTGP